MDLHTKKKVLLVFLLWDYYRRHCVKRRSQTPIVAQTPSVAEETYVREILNLNNPTTCYENFRMDKYVFNRLSYFMRERNLLRDTRAVSVEEQLGMFLYMIGHNQSNRTVQDKFQHSGETVSRYFHHVLKAIYTCARDLIKAPDLNETPLQIQADQRYYPWFKDCVGVIDGTHVNAVVPTERQMPFRSEGKTECTQNVMAACSFNMQFTFVIAGWEGAAYDWEVFQSAVSNPNFNFPHPPTGKYYLVDTGYQNMPGFLAPYQNTHYHIHDFRGGCEPKTKEEWFNYYHSSCRNIIERCFGVLKERFPILKRMAPYSFDTQARIACVCMALHNFIRQQTTTDILFARYEDENVELEHEDTTALANTEMDADSVEDMDTVRDEIAQQIYDAFH